MAPSLDWRQGQLNQAADSVRGAVRIALMFDSPKMHGTMMTSIESSLDDFADAFDIRPQSALMSGSFIDHKL